MNLLMIALFHPSFYQINYFACDNMLGVVWFFYKQASESTKLLKGIS